MGKVGDGLRKGYTVATHAGTLGFKPRPRLFQHVNTDWHDRALMLFGAIIVLHWAEHLVQAFQIWVLNYEKPTARGLLGAQWPWLISSEWLHYGFAVVMVAGLALLLPAFHGRARFFWGVALAIQVWHLFEHQILFYQAQSGNIWFGGKVPTSVLQQYWPMSRPEIHLFYNAIVTIPMIVGVYFHMYPPLHKRGADTDCRCDKTAGKAKAAGEPEVATS